MSASSVSVNGQFFVVRQCMPRSGAEAACAALGGNLAELTSMNIATVIFPELIEEPVCPRDTGTARPTAWFGTWNGGVPEGKVLAIDLLTHQIFADDAATAADWTRLVLGQAHH